MAVILEVAILVLVVATRFSARAIISRLIAARELVVEEPAGCTSTVRSEGGRLEVQKRTGPENRYM